MVWAADGRTIELPTGHWPQSIELSTVGGWVATRASGQFSTGYGSIEDLLLDLEVVLPDGSVLRTRRTPRAAAGTPLQIWVAHVARVAGGGARRRPGRGLRGGGGTDSGRVVRDATSVPGAGG